MLIQLFIVFLTLFVAAFFSYLETAYTSLRPYQLKSMESQVESYYSLQSCWKEKKPHILASILVVSNLAHVIASVIITKCMALAFGYCGLLLGVPVATLSIFLLGEIFPKMYAKSRSEALGPSCLYVLNIILLLFYRPIEILVMLSGKVGKFLGCKEIFLQKGDSLSEEEIKHLIMSHSESDYVRKEMLTAFLEAWNKNIDAIFTVFPPFSFIQAQETVLAASDKCSTYNNEFVVVQHKEKVVGIVTSQRIMEALAKKKYEETIFSLAEKPFFIHASSKVCLLAKHLFYSPDRKAVLVDASKKTLGVITLQNLCQALLGVTCPQCKCKENCPFKPPPCTKIFPIVPFQKETPKDNIYL